MKTVLTAAILGLTGLAGVSAAEAQDQRHYRGESRHERSYSHPRHHRHQAPSFEWVWVPARYESRFAGYDPCGMPVYRRVCVSEGYWTRRPVRCD